MPSILAQSITPTAITVALKSGISTVIVAANIPVADNTPALVSTWATTTLEAAVVSAGLGGHVKVGGDSLTPLVGELLCSDQPITTAWL